MKKKKAEPVARMFVTPPTDHRVMGARPCDEALEPIHVQQCSTADVVEQWFGRVLHKPLLSV